MKQHYFYIRRPVADRMHAFDAMLEQPQTLERALSESPGKAERAENEKEMLVNAVRIVNRRVNLRSEEDDNLSGMGTTLTLLWLGKEQAFLAHVGDSRCYLLRDGELSQVTEDHSMVMEMVKAGVITRDQMRTHPMRNVITRAVGTDRVVQVDSAEMERKEGDIWLICSDGLHGLVKEETMQEVLADPDLEAAADRLLQLALEGGGGDNISLVIVRDGEVEA